jgi:hypothetical protein
MKNYLFAIGFLSCIILSGCTVGYVTTQPANVTYVRPVSPGSGYVWIGGEWEWTGGNYRWHEGSWQSHHEGRAWKSGYWENNHKGYRWHKGHWE